MVFAGPGGDIGISCLGMSAWKVIERAEPEFAERVRMLFDAGRHKTIATLRADGSPRISGIECEFTDGDLRLGSMTGAAEGSGPQAGFPLRPARPNGPP